MSKPKSKVRVVKPDPLFDRIVSILEQARGNVVRAVNTNMVAQNSLWMDLSCPQFVDNWEIHYE